MANIKNKRRKGMKKVLVFMTIITIAVLLTGCFPTPSMDTVEDVQIKIVGIEQEVFCGTKSPIMVKCGYCPPQCPTCPGCDSCCPDCPECEVCEQCETCQECPETEECPVCQTCCCGLEWGNLFVDFQLTNQGNVDSVIDYICVKITYQDGTKTIKYAEAGYAILIGETYYKQIEYKLDYPAKRVVFVELVNEIIK